MTIEEAIEIIKIAESEIEWYYPMDYVVAFDMAINALEEQKYRSKNDDNKEDVEKH